MYSNCVMLFVLYPTKSEYYNILQRQTEQFKSSLYQFLSDSLSRCYSRKNCIFTVTCFEQTLNQSVYGLCKQKVVRWKPSEIKIFFLFGFHGEVYSSVRIRLFSFEEEKLLCFNICRHFKKNVVLFADHWS